MAAPLPCKGSATQPRATPWGNQGPEASRSEGTPHGDARRAQASHPPPAALLQSALVCGVFYPGRCPGLVCQAPVGLSTGAPAGHPKTGRATPWVIPSPVGALHQIHTGQRPGFLHPNRVPQTSPGQRLGFLRPNGASEPSPGQRLGFLRPNGAHQGSPGQRPGFPRTKGMKP